jgi:hypothetical protein
MEYNLVNESMRKKHGAHMMPHEFVEIYARWQIGDTIFIAAVIKDSKDSGIIHHEILKIYDGKVEYTFLTYPDNI